MHDQKGTDQTALLKRLRRIEGQVRGIAAMVEDKRYCIEIVQQVSAVRKALDQVALKMMENHIDHCVRNALQQPGGDDKIKELMQTLNRLIK